MTAIPFKSEPQLAAVGDVFGTLSVDVSEMWMKSAEIPRALLATCKRYHNDALHIQNFKINN
jgi:hypothetical protein